MWCRDRDVEVHHEDQRNNKPTEPTRCGWRRESLNFWCVALNNTRHIMTHLHTKEIWCHGMESLIKERLLEAKWISFGSVANDFYFTLGCAICSRKIPSKTTTNLCRLACISSRNTRIRLRQIQPSKLSCWTIFSKRVLANVPLERFKHPPSRLVENSSCHINGRNGENHVVRPVLTCFDSIEKWSWRDIKT